MLVLFTNMIFKKKRFQNKARETMIIDWFMVLNATFNNISVRSWQSDSLVEETGVPRQNHRPAASH